MRYLIVLLICFYSGTSIQAQAPDSEGQIFVIVEKMPEFKGGEENLIAFLKANTTYPKSARENGISGTVYITFVVEGDGEISNIKVLKTNFNTVFAEPFDEHALQILGFGLTEEALRVVSLMPKWEPGRQDGKPIRVQYTLPIKFTLRDTVPLDTIPER
ncbi:MAG: energy transducer TonB [Bacteroidia bacterium]|jgi:TonB family protein